MKIRVNFTVEVDLDQYNEAQARYGIAPVDNSTFRRMVQNTASDAVSYWLGDQGIDHDNVHNN